MHRDRRGFTIVELLIVVTIIGVLLGLALQVMGGLINAARETATAATLSKAQRLLNSRAQALERLMHRAYYVESSGEASIVNSLFPQQPKAVRKILARKLIAAKFFPQHSAELVDSTGYLGTAQFYPKLFSNGSPVVGLKPDEIFCQIVTGDSAVGYGTVAADSFSAQEVSDADGNGFPSLVDGWRNPIRFYRWPTRLMRPQGQPANTPIVPQLNPADLQNANQLLKGMLPSNVQSLAGSDAARDPDDPMQELWAAFQNPVLEAVSIGGVSMPTPATWHVFLVVSAGPDGVLGLYEPDDVPNNGHLAAVKDVSALDDDIVSFTIRAGGR